MRSTQTRLLLIFSLFLSSCSFVITCILVMHLHDCHISPVLSVPRCANAGMPDTMAAERQICLGPRRSTLWLRHFKHSGVPEEITPGLEFCPTSCVQTFVLTSPAFCCLFNKTFPGFISWYFQLFEYKWYKTYDLVYLQVFSNITNITQSSLEEFSGFCFGMQLFKIKK